MSAAEDVAEYLQSKSLGTLGTDLFYGNEPEDRDLVLTTTLYDTGGSPGESYEGYQDPFIQVRIRATDYNTGYARGEAIKVQTIERHAFDYGGWHYTGFWLVSDIAKIGRDEHRREIFTLNLRLMREPLET